MNERTCIVVVQVDSSPGMSSTVGLVVDAVEEVSSFSPDDIGDPPNFGTQLSTDYIIGMAKTRGHVKILLDIDRIITADAIPAMGEQTIL